ncbi:MAG: hypothetical protein WBY69_12990 [Candidatus Acidiferrales bacterium]
MSDDASYEIFKKELDNTTLRIESVKGMEQAQMRIVELSRTGAGEYFIFDPAKASVVEASSSSAVKDPLAP